MHSINKVDENIEKIGKLFPNCITERKNENGEVEYAVDFDMLKQELSSVVVEGNEERYQFTWPDKKKSILLANAPIAKTLRPCREESVDFDNTENLYIEGDNLDVLKLLQETYLGKIKMIYIDPPYNTGNDFVYEDDFAISVKDYLAMSGQFDEDGNRLFQNNESNGRYHTDWLNMIYPRLKLSKDLLSDDGVLFMSIDNNESNNLSKICDEIFGKQNFVANMVWQKKTGASDATHIATITENILVYAKNTQLLKLEQNEDAHDSNRYKYKDKYYTERGAYYYDSLDRGTLGYHETLDYPVIAPDGTEVYPNGRNCAMNDGWRWKWGKEKLNWGIKNGFIEVRENKSKKNGWGVYYKIYENVDNDGNIIKRSSPYKNLITDVLNTHASSEAKEIFGRTDYFSNPKPVNLIKHFIHLGTDDNDIVLDFFSGSATTAHSMMKLNAEDGKHRKFILVQLPEIIDIKSTAYKAGYKNICEIGKERIRRAGTKIKEDLKDSIVTKNGVTAVRRPKPENSIYENNSADIMDDPILIKTVDEWKTRRPEEEYNEIVKNLDTGFRVLKLDSTNMKDVYYNPAEYELSLFDTLANNIKEDRTPEDLLFQVMLDLGILLSSKIEESTISGKKVFNVADGFLYACFDENVTEDVITEIAKKNPYYFVMRDSSMENDSVATNFEQIFATYSPDTVRKVL